MVASAMNLQPGLGGLLTLCELIDEPLAPYQRRIARAYFGRAREVAAILPRGCAKTSLAALIGLHHLLSTDGAMVTIGAASRDQARICFERMRGFAQHEALDDVLVIRHLELRHPEGAGLLRVVPSDGPRVHGLSSTLYIADEVWSWPDAGLLEAMQTGLVKRPDSKLIVISTAAARLDSPLGRMRARALAQPTAKRAGPVIEARGDLHWLEWSVPDDTDLDDLRAVKACNPAPWITVANLRRQRQAVPDQAFAQFHACRWGATEGSWLPAGAWQACVGEPRFEDGEPVWIGVDVGGDRSASAVVWVNAELHVGAAIYHGDSGVLDCIQQVRDLADRYSVREVVFDPWRFGQARAGARARTHPRPRVPTDRRADGPRVDAPARRDHRTAPRATRRRAARLTRRARRRPPLTPRLAPRQSRPHRSNRRADRPLHGPRARRARARARGATRVALKPCLVCGKPTRGSRCPAHTYRRGSTRSWRNLREHILRKDRDTCRYCGAPASHVDHVIPIARGGTDQESNLVAACVNCNLEKGGR
jgi:hypothetical protein